MTFPAPEISDPPQYNDYGNDGTSKLRNSPPSTATVTIPFPPPRYPQSLSNSPRPSTTSMTVSVGRRGEGGTMNKRSDIPTEFYIPVELYLSPNASAGLRRVCSSLPPLPLLACSICFLSKHFIFGFITHLDTLPLLLPSLSLLPLPCGC